MSPAHKTALILVDVQYDFLPPAGSLSVPDGLSILAPTLSLLSHVSWDLIVASIDYHPPSHISFASRYPGTAPFSSIQVPTLDSEGPRTRTQDLWPDHCVRGTRGGEIEESVQKRLEELDKGEKGEVWLVRKGTELDTDAYSAFDGLAYPFSGDKAVPGVDLSSLFLQQGITEIYVLGLATDYCVKATTTSAAQLGEGVKVHVVRDAVRGVDVKASVETLIKLEKETGVEVTESGEVVKRLAKVSAK